ncbi:MAG: hypothetical protein H7Y07_17805, partial [Pyrinomonadaceae bacterium]|nr:hypothetical protein [Sphingobacteriaceae bacterium]
RGIFEPVPGITGANTDALAMEDKQGYFKADRPLPDSEPGNFSVAIIPYTFEYTNLQKVKPGDVVNLEFDIIGKYVARLMNR